MACAALAHSLWFEDKPLALRVHDIQRRLFVVKPILGKRLVDRVVDILGIEGSNDLPVPLHWAFYGIGPGSHIIQIGLRNRHPRHRPACGEVQPLLGKLLPGIGHPLRLPGTDQRQLCHGLIFLMDADIFLRVIRPGDLLGDQLLELRLIAQDRLNRTLDQVQAFAQVLNGGRGHLLGYLPRHRKNNHPKNAENRDDGQQQGNSAPFFPFV